MPVGKRRRIDVHANHPASVAKILAPEVGLAQTGADHNDEVGVGNKPHAFGTGQGRSEAQG